MTLDQAFAFAIVIGMMAMFVWGRLRYDLVAVLALLASVATGIVPADEAFSGFSDDIIIIVASALLVSAAVARSGVIDILLRRVGPYLTSTRMQVFGLVGAVTLLSAFVKNIGALAMLIPVAFQLARRTGTSPSCLLMPMAFGSLLGGLMTLIGTSPNHRFADARRDFRRAVPYVRFPAGRPRACAGRSPVPELRLPASAACPARDGVDGRCFHHQGLYRRGEHPGRFAERGQDRGRTGGAGRG
jgi:hypothetical protein